ncbi:MAG: TetR/AcrR family transcriptional regulator [Alphaproteobacteria bacterium]|nr:TetR/AcrR family transcriptional regulator [Alphaproteobacteria bacterium]
MGRPREVTDEQIILAARRCFFARGVGVSAAEIARDLGVSHTTLFNRFGSKEGLLIAALGPPKKVPWVAELESGPDERPVRQQLVEHAQVIATYFRELQRGLGLLQAAGIDPSRAFESKEDEESQPAQAYRTFVGWLQRARDEGRIADCDIETVASTILGSLHGYAFTARVCSGAKEPAEGEHYVERFIDILWSGIGV